MPRGATKGPAHYRRAFCRLVISPTLEAEAAVLFSPPPFLQEPAMNSSRSRLFRATMLVIGIASLLVSSLAEAQWVLVARRAIGRIEQMSQSQQNGPSYDSAAVMIDAPADKVYTAVVRGVKNAQGISVTS